MSIKSPAAPGINLEAFQIYRDLGQKYDDQNQIFILPKGNKIDEQSMQSIRLPRKPINVRTIDVKRGSEKNDCFSRVWDCVVKVLQALVAFICCRSAPTRPEKVEQASKGSNPEISRVGYTVIEDLIVMD